MIFPNSGWEFIRTFRSQLKLWQPKASVSDNSDEVEGRKHGNKSSTVVRWHSRQNKSSHPEERTKLSVSGLGLGCICSESIKIYPVHACRSLGRLNKEHESEQSRVGFAPSTTPFSVRASPQFVTSPQRGQHYISGISDDEGVSTKGKGRRHAWMFGAQ